MERGVCVITALVLIFRETVGFSIRNEQLGTCMQPLGGSLALEECRPDSEPQQWEWQPHTQALVSAKTGECLSTVGALDHMIVRLQACVAGEGDGDGDGQAWSCSKKGLIALSGSKGLHLSTHRVTAKVVLSRERGRSSRWRTLENHTICEEPGSPHHRHHHGHNLTPTPATVTESASAGADSGATAAPNPTESGPEIKPSLLPHATPGPSNATFFSLEYGPGWEVAMLVLTSLAFVIGLVILVLNIYYNRKKKVMCVVKSYAPTGEVSQQGSPVPNERAPLTRHPMGPPRSPPLQRGEILIEWKDGTVTPLFDTHTLLAD